MRLKPKTFVFNNRVYAIEDKGSRGDFPAEYRAEDYPEYGTDLAIEKRIRDAIGDEDLTDEESRYVGDTFSLIGGMLKRLKDPQPYDYIQEENTKYLNSKFKELHDFFRRKRMLVDLDKILYDMDMDYFEDLYDDYVYDDMMVNPHAGEEMLPGLDIYEPDFIPKPSFSHTKGRIEQDLIDRQRAYMEEEAEILGQNVLREAKNIVGSYVRNYTWHFGGLYSGSKKWREKEYDALSKEDKKKLIQDIRSRDRFINDLIRSLPALEENVMLYRGGRWNDFEIGRIGEFDYITSASFNRNTADRYRGADTMIKILAPRGSHVLSINESENEGNGSIFTSRFHSANQNEVLISRGQRYLVLDAFVSDSGRKEVTIMLLPDEVFDYDFS